MQLTKKNGWYLHIIISIDTEHSYQLTEKQQQTLYNYAKIDKEINVV